MDNRKKNILLGTLIVGVISMTVAFAALSTNLSINGTAGIPTTRWDIHFANGTDNTSGTHANGKVNKGKIEDVNFQATSITGFTVTLYQPNDEVVYNFDIVNAGTIDAELDNFQRSITCASGSELCDEVMTYTIECEDEQHNNALAQGYILEKNKSVSCEMNVKFNDVDNLSKSKSSKVQASVVNGVYTQGALNATIRADWLWVQKSGSNSQNQGGNSGGSGNNEPSNPYETTFDGDYAYKWFDVATEGYSSSSEDGWYTSLNPESKAYLRTTGSLPEGCRVFGSGQSGTVCMTSSYYNSSYSSAGNYNADFEDVSNTDDITTTAGLEATGLKGYSLAKAEEMLTKGASSCDVDDYDVKCYGTGNIYCDISHSGNVYCGGENGIDVSVDYDGSTY